MMLHLGTKEIYFGQKKPKEMAYKELSWSKKQSWKRKFQKDMWQKFLRLKNQFWLFLKEFGLFCPKYIFLVLR